MGRGSRKAGVEPWDPRGRGWGEVSELASGTGWGGGLGAVSAVCTGEGRREEGCKVEVVELEDSEGWIWSCCEGTGSDRVWAVVRRVQGRGKV